jgi:hypothetical protein
MASNPRIDMDPRGNGVGVLPLVKFQQKQAETGFHRCPEGIRKDRRPLSGRNCPPRTGGLIPALCVRNKKW